jgi:hypothetical protein
MYSADKFLCVSLYSRCRSACNFVWVHYCNYLLLTASFSCTLSYMQHDYYQRTSYQCVTSYAASLPIVLRCVRLCVRWYGSCISPPEVAAFCPSRAHLVPQSRYSVLPNYFYGDAIFSRCVAVITAWSCIFMDFTKQEWCLRGNVFTVVTTMPVGNRVVAVTFCFKRGRFPQVLRSVSRLYLFAPSHNNVFNVKIDKNVLISVKISYSLIYLSR